MKFILNSCRTLSKIYAQFTLNTYKSWVYFMQYLFESYATFKNNYYNNYFETMHNLLKNNIKLSYYL